MEKTINVAHVNESEMRRRLFDNDWTPNGFNPYSGFMERQSDINAITKKFIIDRRKEIEDKVIAMAEAGDSVEEIAEKIYRHPTTVKRILHRIGIEQKIVKTFNNYTPQWEREMVAEVKAGGNIREIAKRLLMTSSEVNAIVDRHARRGEPEEEYTDNQRRVYELIRATTHAITVKEMAEQLNVMPTTVYKNIEQLRVRGVVEGCNSTWKVLKKI